MNDDDFYTFDEYSERKAFDELQRRFRDNEDREEAMKKHPAGKDTKNTKNTKRLSDEASTYAGLTIFKFLFVTIPLALLFAGLAVAPFTGAVFGTDLGFWTAFFVLATLRWLIPRPRKAVPLEKIYEQKGR